MKCMGARQSGRRIFGENVQANGALLSRGSITSVSIQRVLVLRYSVSFGDAVLLVAGLPMSPLAVPAAILNQTTASAGR